MGLCFINLKRETETEEGVWEGEGRGKGERLTDWRKKKANEAGLVSWVDKMLGTTEVSDGYMGFSSHFALYFWMFQMVMAEVTM